MLFNEPKLLKCVKRIENVYPLVDVSVLFNEPKLLKWFVQQRREPQPQSFSALQRAEIAEIGIKPLPVWTTSVFQCSSTSRNC